SKRSVWQRRKEESFEWKREPEGELALEQDLLSAMAFHPQEVLPFEAAAMGLTPFHFKAPEHRRAFRALLDIEEAGLLSWIEAARERFLELTGADEAFAQAIFSYPRMGRGEALRRIEQMVEEGELEGRVRRLFRWASSHMRGGRAGNAPANAA
ncbi:MAG: hypothetical protein ACE5LX_02075, partial [Nitrospinota bacterium]